MRRDDKQPETSIQIDHESRRGERSHERGISHSACLELQKAAIKGDVEKAKSLLRENELMLSSAITDRLENVLHLATGAKQTRFVEEMIKSPEFEPSFLRLEDSDGNNAFCYAAMVGSTAIAEKMLEKDPDLLDIPGGGKMTPLYLAIFFGHKDTTSFLYTKHEEVKNVQALFYGSIRNNFFDLALTLLEDNASLALENYRTDGTALHMLARNPSVFSSRSPGLLEKVKNLRKNVTNREMDLSTPALHLVQHLLVKTFEQKGEMFWSYMCTDGNKKMLFEAAELGNSKFLAELIRFYPNFVYICDEKERTIFHIAVMHRHTSIFAIFNDISSFQKLYITTFQDQENNNLLHVAATLQDNHEPVGVVSGAALQLQQELKTFKEVELLVMPSYKEMRNNEGLTPREVFSRDHKNLLKSGKEWMQKTASSCMATIIAITVFVFGLSGNYNNDGMPNQKENSLFLTTFIQMVNAVALASSLISMIMFLSILASRCDERDFLISLPLKLVVGLLTLFVSLATMALSFSASSFVTYDKEKSHLIIPCLISTLVLGPVILFFFLLSRLFTDIFLSLLFSKASYKRSVY